MEHLDLKVERSCSICLNLYTDPVSLRCGHVFCRSCIVSALDAQEAAGGYSCPECRAEYPERPALENIVQCFSFIWPPMATRIFCTYCIKFAVLAVKSCLQCESSLCDNHLTAHNKSLDHILIEPIGSFSNTKCSLHKKVLEYYCPQDAACLCVSCCLVGEHRGHPVERLDEVFKKIIKLRGYLRDINPQKIGILNLQDHKRKIQEQASNKSENVSKIYMDIMVRMEESKIDALTEIYSREKKIVSQIARLIKKLEKQEDELSRKMRHMEEMCCHQPKTRTKK